MTLQKVPGELCDVLAPRPQRRHLDVHAVQAVVQVQPETPQLHQPGQRPVGGHDDPRVDPARPEPADPLDRQILNRPQQLRLRRRREVRDLVEEQRPLVRVLELSTPPTHAGRRPLLDPEQLRFEQRLDDRRTVDGDERPLVPPTELVNLAGDELFARAALALDEHSEIGRGHTLDPVAHGPDREARSDQGRRAV